MPNHYSNVVTASFEGENTDPAALTEWATGLLERIAPTPPDIRHPDPRYMSDAQVEWCNTTRGTKWDVYDIAPPVEIPGDCGAYLIAFCTAWSPPSDEMRALAVADAKSRGIRVLSWVGLDPYDDTAETLYRRSKP